MDTVEETLRVNGALEGNPDDASAPSLASITGAASPQQIAADAAALVFEGSLDDLVDAMSQSSAVASNHASDMDLASVATPVGGYGVHDLFGSYFQVPPTEARMDDDFADVVDPELVDSRTFVEKAFGPHVNESLLVAQPNPDVLKEYMAAAAADDARSEVEDLFGAHVVHALSGESMWRGEEQEHAQLSIVRADMPPMPSASLANTKGELWLAELPKVDPNRQVLHVEPTLYHPSQAAVNGGLIPTTTTRKVYTTQNIIRWTYIKGKQQVLSNARLVSWSDGSRTLHVGRDRFEIGQSTQGSLSVLAAPTAIFKNDVRAEAFVGVQGYHKQVLLKVSDAPSVSDAVVHEGLFNRQASVHHRVAVTTSVPLPQIDPKKPKEDMTATELFIVNDRKRRQKEKDKRLEPMSLGEQLANEQAMVERIKTCDAQDLINEQESAELHRSLTGRAAQHRRREPVSFAGTAVDGTRDLGALLSEINNAGDDTTNDRRRARSDAPQEEEEEATLFRPVPRTEDTRDGAGTNGTSEGGAAALSAAETQTILTTLHSQLPPDSEVGKYVQSLLGMIAEGKLETDAARRSELTQVATDLKQELGETHQDLVRLLAPHIIPQAL